MLEENLKTQLKQYLDLLENDIVLRLNADINETNGKKVHDFVTEIADMSAKISIEKTTAIKSPGFSVDQKDTISGIVFAGLPLGHEFNSLVLALLQVSGRAPKIEDELKERIQSISSSNEPPKLRRVIATFRRLFSLNRRV